MYNIESLQKSYYIDPEDIPDGLNIAIYIDKVMLFSISLVIIRSLIAGKIIKLESSGSGIRMSLASLTTQVDLSIVMIVGLNMRRK